MSLSRIIAVLILCISSLAFADNGNARCGTENPDNARNWTILAARMYAEKGNVEKKPVVTDPGVFVTAQRDPHDKK